MATLIITSETGGGISLNGSFLSFIKSGGSLSVPLGSSPSFISFFPADCGFLPAFFMLEYSGSLLKAQPCCGKLFRWSDDIYELRILPRRVPCPPPPIITCETRWGDGYAGLAGGYFVCQDSRGSRYCADFPAEKFSLLSENFVLLESNTAAAVINRDTHLVHPPFCRAEHFFDGRILTVTFSPGEMDFFTVTQKFSVDGMRLVSSSCKCESACTVPDRLRCFCQAVRLGMKDEAESFLTDSLKRDMSFEDIREFLGVFDETDLPEYVFKERENTVALRYMLDEWNFHYMCFEFVLKGSLIDDICQL